MNAERWRRVEELFHASLEREASEREPFLAAACNGDDELRREVRSLLAGDANPHPILDEGPAIEWSEDLEPRTGLGPYRIEGKLGEGGMGVVYRATDTRLGRDVAVKVLQRGLGTEPQSAERFIREARAISSINHPNICSLFDVGEHDGIPFLVMELAEGETLAERLAKGALAPGQVAQFGGQIADALAAAHARGIVHRDLKPGNVMLTRTGVKLLDFGLAKLAGPQSAGAQPSLTGDRAIAGTPGYMSPEQAEGRECDARSDIYALGLVLYEMAAGKPYNAGATKILQPPRLNQIVQRCVSKDSAERWHSATDVRLLLELAASEPPPAPTAKARWPWAAVAAAVAVAIVAGAIWMRRETASPASVAHLRVDLPEGAVPHVSFPRLALSPDGRKLAILVVGAKSKKMLWVRDLDSPVPRLLDGAQDAVIAQDAVMPFWSPDSEWIGYATENRVLAKIRQSGGPSHRIAEGTFVGGGAWSLDGTILIGKYGGEIWSVSADGSEPPAPVTKLGPMERQHRFPAFLPGDRRFSYLSINANPAEDAMYVQALGETNRKQVLLARTAAAIAPSGHALFTRANTLLAQRMNLSSLALEGSPLTLMEGLANRDEMSGLLGGIPAFSVSSNGSMAYVSGSPTPRSQLVWLDRRGARMGTVGEAGPIAKFTMSRDQSRAAVEVFQGSGREIRLVNLKTGASSLLPHEPGTSMMDPVWSPDSKRLAVGVNRAGRGQIRVIDTSSMAVSTLYADYEAKYLDDWSADGRFILYHGEGNFALPLVGVGKPIRLNEGAIVWDQVTVSPDGRWIAFNSTDSYEVFVASFPGARHRRQVSVGGGGQAVWSPSGRELYYVGSSGQLMMAPLTLGTDGESLEPGVPAPLFDIGLTNSVWTQYQLSADAQRILTIQPVSAGPANQVHIVLNWPELLKRR